MPHSGGGGSHGGGHHSGSSHGGGSGGRRVSSSYFNGANRYVYYHRGRPYIYYSTSPEANPRTNALGLLFFGVIWTAFTVLILAVMVKFSGGGPLPLDYDTQIVIRDEIGVITDEAALRRKMEDFQDKTGITLAVMALTPETAERGEDCEIQSYNAYVKNWDDESHWLIYYVGSKKNRTDNWQWNLMCGDDCTRILDSRQEAVFTAEFHKNLLRDMTFEEAVTGAVDKLEPSLTWKFVYRDNVSVNGEPSGGQKVDAFMLVFLGVFLVVGLAVLAGGIKTLVCPSEESIAKSKAVKTISATSQLQEAKCAYCDGLYYIGTVTSCPHCGASLPLSGENDWQ